MSYLVFLAEWYNWPYLVAALLGGVAMVYPQGVEGLGAKLRGLLRLERAAPRSLLRIGSVAFAMVGLTLNGALHDYWPAAQESGFLPVLLVTSAVALTVTRGLGRVLERHFPEIKAVRWGGPGLTGQRGRVVSQQVSADYRAGRAQIMGEDRTLHVVWCKTREVEIPYGAMVVLGEYDAEDDRYYVERVD